MKGLKRALVAVATSTMFVTSAMAEEVAAVANSGELLSTKGLAAIAMAIAAAGAGGAQGKAISAALDSIGRNPGASSSLFLPWVLALALIESLAILTFVVCLMVI